MTRRSPQLRTKKGFTIVELLIVIVVIGILAGIVIVSYGGWHTNVITSQVKSDLDGASSAMENAKTFTSGYPTSGSLPANITTLGLTFTPSSGDTLLLALGSSSTAYCIDATNSTEPSVVYYIDNALRVPTAGTCASRTAVAPSNLLAQTVSTTSITTTWSYVPNATSYLVQESTSSSFTSPTAATVTGLTNTFTSLAAGTQYYFRVQSITSSGVSGPTWSSTAIGATLPSGLVAWWPLDGNANDQSGNSNTGTVLSATLTSGQNGQTNGAYSFNGTSSQITALDTSSLSPTGPVTVSVWAMATTLPSSTLAGLVVKDRSSPTSNPPYALVISATDYPQWETDNASDTTVTVSGTTTLTTGTWYNLVGTFDGATMTLYVNGVAVATGSQTSIADTTGLLRMGQQKDTYNRWFNGIIDDVRIYNVALSPTVIQALYNAGAQ